MFHSVRAFTVATGVAFGASACGWCGSRAPSSETPDAAPGTASTASGRSSPLARLAPRHRAFPRPACPLAIEPGVGFGYIDLGETREDLEKIGIPVTEINADGVSVLVEIGALKADLCAGKVVEIWMPDLREAPDCVTLGGKPVARAIRRQDLEARITDCAWDGQVGVGGADDTCQDGGVTLGYGPGEFLTLRVRAPGPAFANCAVAMDDGAPFELDAAKRKVVLAKTLGLDALSKHWHPSTPGRDPLRIVKTDLFADKPTFNMFGSPVVWIEPTEATPGSAYFEITKLVATKTRIDVEFRYPVENLTGHVAFRTTPAAKGITELESSLR